MAREKRDPTNGGRFCPYTGKEMLDKGTSKSLAKRLARRGGGTDCHAYRCRCGKWHVGSLRRKQVGDFQ